MSVKLACSPFARHKIRIVSEIQSCFSLFGPREDTDTQTPTHTTTCAHTLHAQTHRTQCTQTPTHKPHTPHPHPQRTHPHPPHTPLSPHTSQQNEKKRPCSTTKKYTVHNQLKNTTTQHNTTPPTHSQTDTHRQHTETP